MLRESDEIIWRLCLQGDRQAFEALYRKFYPVLFNYGKLFSQDPDFIRNCIQNFFVKLITKHTSLSETTSVSGYLLKAFRHTLYNELKSEQIRNDVFTGYTDEVKTVHAENVLNEDELTPNNILISAAFKKLSSKQQEILYLYYIRELTHEEIAVILNINYQSSKNLLFRSISKLRELLLADPSWSLED